MADALERSVSAAIAQIRGPGPVGVACSGGPDSMALAEATVRAAGAGRVTIVTIDHGLTAGSQLVCEAVAAWARTRGCAAVVRRVEVARRASLEAAARDARYAALDQVARELGLVAILVGHTARDQAETVVMRLLRGTGPAGLAAMPDQRGPTAPGGAPIVRPLLAIERAEVEAYVAAHGLPTWHDPMNDDLAIARVRIRLEVLPLLRRENPQVDLALTRLASAAGEWLEVIDAIAGPLARAPIDCNTLATQPAAIRKRVLSLVLEAAGLDCEAVHLEALDRLVTQPSRGEVGVDVPGGRVVRSYTRLAVERHDAAPGEPDACAIAVPVGHVIRVWRAGDRMRPARLKGQSRKLSDLYGDAKIPRAARVSARVVVRVADDVIVWAEHIGIAHGEHESVLALPA
jgi:tRNA(Ile)-lysidine synthase